MNKRPLELALSVVDSEPELPGDMPTQMHERAFYDPSEFARDVVRATKRCIAERLKLAFREMDEELRHMIEQGPAVVMVGRQEFLRLMSAAGEDPRALGNPPQFTDERVVKLAQVMEEVTDKEVGDLILEHATRSQGASPSLVLARGVLHRMEGHKPCS